MRRVVLALSLVIAATLIAGPAAADSHGMEYSTDSIGESLGTGLNGMLTAIADPLHGLIEGSGVTDTPLASNLIGLVSGTFTAGARFIAGGTDVLTAFIPETPNLSPKPRYSLVPGTK